MRNIAGEYHMAKRPLALPASPSGNLIGRTNEILYNNLTLEYKGPPGPCFTNCLLFYILEARIREDIKKIIDSLNFVLVCLIFIFIMGIFCGGLSKFISLSYLVTLSWECMCLLTFYLYL
jgi:hypothetical protein